jgi:hypothetical protein
MKTVYKFLKTGALALTLTAAGVTATFAQDATATPDPAAQKIELYTKFTDCWTKDLKPTEKAGSGGDKAAIDACVAVGKEYLDKYGNPPDQYSKFVQTKYDLNTKGRAGAAVATRFDKALNVPDIKNINAQEVFASGKDFIAANPDSVDALLAVASVGYDQASAATPVDTYNADTINYAKAAIDKMNAGKVSQINNAAGKPQYGIYRYVYTTDKFPDGKSNALGWMNYYIGYIMYNRMNQKKEALPYLYKATQANSETKNTAEVYRLIGSWYADEFKRLDDERVAKVKAAGDQDTDETKAIYAMQKGYAERAADAYARAFKVVSPSASAEYKNALQTRAKQLYGIRFNNDPTKVDGYDAFAANLATKPFVDPATAVTPVVEAPPATTAPTTGTPTAGTTPTTTTVAPSTTTAPTATPKPTTTTTTPSTTTKPAPKSTTTTTPSKPSAKTSTTTKKTSR